MDIVSILYVLLFLLFIVLLILIAGHATIISVIFALVSIVGVSILLMMIIKYSQKITPSPVIEKMESPLPMIGGICEVLDDISPTKEGYVRYRGELWRAFSVKSTLKRGDYAYVVDVRGRFLIIEREPVKIEE